MDTHSAEDYFIRQYDEQTPLNSVGAPVHWQKFMA
jgi:hypothetical protein